MVLKAVLIAFTMSVAFYAGILLTLTIAPSLQAYVVYLHKVTLTWGKDLNVPEQFGMLRNQAVPFNIETEDKRNEEAIVDQSFSGPVEDITTTVNFQLLRDDPEARLVLYMHGTSGTLGSTIRPTSYRNIYSGASDKIHVLAFDYRGYGLSSGFPSETGLLLDAIAITKWATNVAKISPDRIVIYGQSLGSAVSISLVNHMAMLPSAIPFAGVVVSAAFADLPTLVATYKIGGMIPVLSPVAKIPPLLRYFTSRLQDTWSVKDKIAEFVRQSRNHHVTLIHAEDDTDIPYTHSQEIFWYAVNATTVKPMAYEDLAKEMAKRVVDLGPGGRYYDWDTQDGSIRLQILKHGEHDWQMSYPATAGAIVRAFRSKHPNFAM